MLLTERRIERLEALVLKGAAADAGARTALLGTEKRSPFKLSQLFLEYEAAIKDERATFHPISFASGRRSECAVKGFVEVVGDKPVTEAKRSLNPCQ